MDKKQQGQLHSTAKKLTDGERKMVQKLYRIWDKNSPQFYNNVYDLILEAMQEAEREGFEKAMKEFVGEENYEDAERFIRNMKSNKPK